MRVEALEREPQAFQLLLGASLGRTGNWFD